MGRRSLPTIDPAVSLQDHLLVLQDLPETLDPQTLFARRQPLEIEIGSGKGLFLATHSAHHPERNFLALKSRESTRGIQPIGWQSRNSLTRRLSSVTDWRCFTSFCPIAVRLAFTSIFRTRGGKSGTGDAGS